MSTSEITIITAVVLVALSFCPHESGLPHKGNALDNGQEMYPSSYRDLIAEWPTVKAFANELGVPPERAFGWWRRDAIPTRYWSALIKMQARHNRVLTPEMLLVLTDRPSISA